MTTSHIDSEYQASAIEPQVQQDWDNRKVFKVADTVEGKHRYILSMFPTQVANCIWGMCVTTPLVT
jgi:leucyl-tRNA synthetase